MHRRTVIRERPVSLRMFLGWRGVTSVCCSCPFVGVPEQVMELADLELMMST